MPLNRLVASVAQLVEQLTLNQLVLGSSPSRGTNFAKEITHTRPADTLLARKTPQHILVLRAVYCVNKLGSMEFAIAR